MKRKFFRVFWELFKGYWNSEEKWRARGLLAFVIALNFATVYLLVRINSWYNEFYNALQNYEEGLFWPLVGEFTLLAFIYIFLAVYAIYLRQLLEIKWRTWMTDEYLAGWLKKQVYYRLQLLGLDTDNPDQRISEDINQFVSLTLQLLIGALKECTTLAAFGVVLWELSGSFTLEIGGFSWEIVGYMFWFSLLYSILGTVGAHIAGRKLIGLNYEQQRFEADFRFNMMRVRENSESVAFYAGEKAENKGFKERFLKVIKNYRGLMRQTKILNFYVNGYAQLAVIVPLVMAAPRYFAGSMTLGGLMQTSSAFGRVQDALSFFVTSYSTLAQLAAVIRRLGGFTEHMEEVAQVTGEIKRVVGESESVRLERVNINLPDGQRLLTDCRLELSPGTRLIVVGASGAGKSTFLRLLAGIWPYGQGNLYLPPLKQILFLPQRPYLPLGSLRHALCYPLEEETKDETLKEVLVKVGLGHFQDRLDEVDDWSRILSLGEQQRLAFARVLLVKPRWIFLDEATSALDEPREATMYDLLAEELPYISVVSVGHRSTLLKKHRTMLRLTGDGAWEYGEIKAEERL
ncbi:MAG: ABC transporter ATP-binding protein/permease [Selenomonadaceae bacterium]|nr:ABC transporter ATP-binding protein/permease [Selenomonadaceae bacterium]